VAAVPVPHTFVDGVYSTSEANTYLRDPLLFLQTPPMAELRQTAAQSIPNGTFTALLFDTSDVDKDYLVATNAGHSTSSNTSRYTARFPGWYQCSGGVSIAANAVGVRGAYWYVNGSPLNGTESMGTNSGATNHGTVPRTKHIYLNIGDYVELFCYQTSGGALNTAVSTFAQSSMTDRWVSN
jgi:hypothetical protein